MMLTGSSGAGKTTLAAAVARRAERLVVRDFDEVGVPERADHRWRQRLTEHWVGEALRYQRQGIDLLLTGPSPMGEILAVPSAPQLNGIAVCLVDVADAQRRVRLRGRDPGRWSDAALDRFVGWAAWHRQHAADPGHRAEVITRDGWPAMAWSRWIGWSAGDRRWCTALLDTTGQPVQQAATALQQWVQTQREDHRAGRLALAPGWADIAEPDRF